MDTVTNYEPPKNYSFGRTEASSRFGAFDRGKRSSYSPLREDDRSRDRKVSFAKNWTDCIWSN